MCPCLCSPPLSDKTEKVTAKFLVLFEGPYIIYKQVGQSTFILHHTESPLEREMFNSSELKPYVSRLAEAQDDGKDLYRN